MALSSLWLRGLSSQGKVYLATGSVAIGSATTGVLAVEGTRGQIVNGVGYAGLKAGNLLSNLVAADSGGREIVGSNDSNVNGIFKEAWDGLKLVVTKGANWSWSSTIFLGDKVTKAKNTYTTIKGYTTSSWDFLKKNWFTLWLFLRSSYREIDLKKLYEWLSSPKISKTITESKGKWDTVMSKFQSLASHSGKIGFNVAKPYQKIFKEFMSNPDNLPTWLGLVGERLDILDSYLKDKTQSNLSNVNVLIDFFSSSEDNIKKLEYKSSGK